MRTSKGLEGPYVDVLTGVSHCEVVQFHGRKSVFLLRSEGITIGLSERAEEAAPVVSPAQSRYPY
jgi:hypothetical protein